MQKKLKFLEKLIEDTRKSERELEKKFDKNCQQMHLDKIVNSTCSAIDEIKKIMCPCEDQDYEGDIEDSDEEVAKVNDAPSVEYLNKLLCELQEISLLARESKYYCDQLKNNLEERVNEILSIKLSTGCIEPERVDQGMQTDKFFNEDFKSRSVKKEKSSSLEGKFAQEDHFSLMSSVQEDLTSFQDRDSWVLEKKKFEDKSISVKIPDTPKETSDKSTETVLLEHQSVECQADLDESQAEMLSQVVQQTLDETLTNIASQSITSISQEESKNMEMIKKQENLIDELNRELIIKDSELYELQIQFADIKKINNQSKETLSKVEKENVALKSKIKELNEKIKNDNLRTEEENEVLKMNIKELNEKIHNDSLKFEEETEALKLQIKELSEKIKKEELKKIKKSPLKQFKSQGIDVQSLPYPELKIKSAEHPEDPQSSLSKATKIKYHSTEDSLSLSISQNFSANSINSANVQEDGQSSQKTLPAKKKSNSIISRRSSENSAKNSLASRESSMGVRPKVQKNKGKNSVSTKKLAESRKVASSDKIVSNPGIDQGNDREIGKDHASLLAEIDSMADDVENPNLKMIAWKIINTGFKSLGSEDLNLLHCQIVMAEFRKKPKTKVTTIHFKSTEVSCNSVTRNSLSRIGPLLERLHVCKLRAKDFQEKLLYRTLEKILTCE
ncbi:early endosome antigen 1-like [Phlebotomus papatasi]|uniref:early endosome antigen 1-like n=1 Tax=Phlebotomus papatasi TaxID=29031 RepID=UPI0024836C8E|nr:early endosome antigen 1-like [Phlebotomus papatasi]